MSVTLTRLLAVVQLLGAVALFVVGTFAADDVTVGWVVFVVAMALVSAAPAVLAWLGTNVARSRTRRALTSSFLALAVAVTVLMHVVFAMTYDDDALSAVALVWIPFVAGLTVIGIVLATPPRLRRATVD